MLSKQEEEQERRATIENDRLVREAEHRRIQREGTTMYQHAQSAANDEAGGRFASVNPTRVIGATPNIAAAYPAASTAHQTELPPEPPLSAYENPTLGESSMAVGGLPFIEDTGGAPSSPCEDVVAPPLSFGTMAAQGMSQISAPSGEDDAVRLARPPVSTDAGNG
jgi:hypothetical protein